MPKAHLTFQAVREIGLTLPNVVESTIHGAPSLKVRDSLLACVPVHKSAEPNCVVIRIDLKRRTALLRANPDIYYVTDHYAGHPAVLVRLSCIRNDELRELLELAWRFVSSKRPARASDVDASRAVEGPKNHRRKGPAPGSSGRRGG